MRIQMISKSKIAKARLIIKNQGLGTLIRKAVHRLFRSLFPLNPEEYVFIYKALSNHSRSNIMIDVGAETGASLSDFADAGWKIFAFEPDDRNRDALTTLFGSHDNVTIDSRAVSNEISKDVKFYKSAISSGISGLSAFDPSHVENGTVDTTTLSAYINENDINDVDFLKIDTEGHDLFVLEGFPWEEIQPRVIMCEFDDAKTVPLGFGWIDIATMLKNNGYQIIVSEWYPIIQYGGSHQWRRFEKFPCKLMEDNAWGNLLASNNELIFNDLVHQCTQFQKKMRN